MCRHQRSAKTSEKHHTYSRDPQTQPAPVAPCFTRRVIFELIWRDFFRFFALKHGNKIFFEGGTSDTPLMWSSDPELWQRWRDGKTGLPLVDANMRELAATGEVA